MTTATMSGSDSGIEILPMEEDRLGSARSQDHVRIPLGLDDELSIGDGPHDITDFGVLGDTSGVVEDEEDLLNPFGDIEVDPETGTTRFGGGFSFKRS